jgi:hypothetical protein
VCLTRIPFNISSNISMYVDACLHVSTCVHTHTHKHTHTHAHTHTHTHTQTHTHIHTHTHTHTQASGWKRRVQKEAGAAIIVNGGGNLDHSGFQRPAALSSKFEELTEQILPCASIRDLEQCCRLHHRELRRARMAESRPGLFNAAGAAVVSCKEDLNPTGSFSTSFRSNANGSVRSNGAQNGHH